MTAYKSDLQTGNKAIPYGNHANEVISVRATFALTAALAATDTIELCTLPKGSVPVASSITLVTDELDTDVSPTLQIDVGDSVDPNALIDSSVHGAALNIQGANVKTAYNYAGSETADTVILATVTDNPATGATSGDLIFEMSYRVM